MNNELVQIIATSLQVAFFSTLLVITTALVLVFALSYTRSKILLALELVIYLPMALPPVALGYFLLTIFSPNSGLGQYLHNYLHIDVAFTFIGAVVAAYLSSLGIGVRSLRIACASVEQEQCHLAEICGASKRQVFWHIILPQCRPAIFGGAILVFVRSMGEFGATMVLAGNTLGQTRTLALAIWSDMQTPGKEEQAMTLALIAMAISLLALLSAELGLRVGRRA